MTEKELRNKVVATARSYLGCGASDGSHRKIIDLYNSHKPLARGYTVKYTDAWCATFVSAVAIQCGLTDIIPLECGCGKYIELARKMGIWVEDDAFVPQAGDILLYDWQDSGVGDNRGAADHIGIVAKVSGKTIQIIEGNKGNAVGCREVAVNGRYIRGWVTPRYSAKATAAEKPAAAEKKATGTAKSFQKAVAGTYVVAPEEGLHVRNGAGASSGSMVVLPQGTRAACYGYYSEVKGVKWLYIQTTYGGVKYTGFAAETYLKKV